MCAYEFEPIDITLMRSHSIRQRATKVDVTTFGKPYQQGSGVASWIDSLPQILAGQDFRKLITAIQKAKAQPKALIWGLGGHVIKCGLGPIFIDLMRRGYVTAVALNGAGAIHDFEVALAGNTSEDVAKELHGGSFGTSAETGEWMNAAIQRGGLAGQGIGEALGAYLHENAGQFDYLPSSLLAAAYARHIPVTVHVAIGTDTIHNHPGADGSALGKGSLQDFRLLTSIVRHLNDGGVFLNCGSAVLLPEVFLKTVNMVRNLGYPLENFTTVNLDFIQHYRPVENVVRRPTLNSGQGICLTGHHELMIPLLAAALIETGPE
jgi:hypothetical protein